MHVRREYMMAVNRDRIIIDTQAMLEYASNNDKADSTGQIGAVGFCMSGPLVMGLLQRMPEKVAAVASIHGAWLVSNQDDSPHKEIDQIKGEVYFGWADNDPTATREELEIMDKALADQGVNYRIEFMQGALHGFAPPGGERYHRGASEKHWERVHDLFRRNLNQG